MCLHLTKCCWFHKCPTANQGAHKSRFRVLRHLQDLSKLVRYDQSFRDCHSDRHGSGLTLLQETRRDLDQTPDEVPVENLSGAASSIPLSLPLVSASNYLTVLPVETEFDSKAQAVVHGTVDAVTERDSTTFEAIEGMAVFDSETQSFWVAPRPRDKSGLVYDELSDTDKKKFDASRFKEIDNLLKLERSQCGVSRGK